jgi:hypothetical protein
VLLYAETPFLGYSGLAPLDLCVVELFDMPALQANEMVVVTALIEFEYGLA